MNWKNKLKIVIFCAKKKVTLDRPGGFSYYYDDLRKEQRRQMGGGHGVWAGISYYIYFSYQER